MTTEKLRWGILGTGMIARKFAADLPSSQTGVIAATASRTQASADAFAADYGGKGIEGYQQLLADPDVDAVYISLPNGLHAEWSVAAMEAGKHVLCEKPIACNKAEAETMFAASERTGQVLVEAFMYRTTPAVKAVINLIRRGEIGDLRLMRTNFTFCARGVAQGCPIPSGARWWRPDGRRLLLHQFHPRSRWRRTQRRPRDGPSSLQRRR